MEAGNYDVDNRAMVEDFELELRMLKKFGYIHNMEDILLKYRIHENQVTFNGGIKGSEYWMNIRNKIIVNLINN